MFAESTERRCVMGASALVCKRHYTMCARCIFLCVSCVNTREWHAKTDGEHCSNNVRWFVKTLTYCTYINILPLLIPMTSMKQTENMTYSWCKSRIPVPKPLLMEIFYLRSIRVHTALWWRKKFPLNKSNLRKTGYWCTSLLQQHAEFSHLTLSFRIFTRLHATRSFCFALSRFIRFSHLLGSDKPNKSWRTHLRS